MQVVRGRVRDMEAADPAIPLNQGGHCMLRRDWAVCPVGRLAADVGSIGFDRHAGAAGMSPSFTFSEL